MNLEDLAIVGNCQYAALVEKTGAIVWCCLPRFDSEPVFASLLDERDGGSFSIRPLSGAPGRQSYLHNTNVLETRFANEDGEFRILDFAPRFVQHARTFRPTYLMRIVEPITGAPRIQAVCDPVAGWSKARPGRSQGSHHVRFEGMGGPLRLTTDIPLAYLDGRPFVLTGRRHFILTWDVSIDEAVPALCERFLNETVRYWRAWVKHCNIPPLFQEEVIRSALALKLHCYEDTGAIVAAVTTSIPESAKSGRTWDYRYCWLRDAYYSLDAFRLLGHFEERESFLDYLLNIVAGTPSTDLAPLYRVDGSSQLEESVLTQWAGFNGDGPVRVGNAAATHLQNDIFGECVLALAPMFLDHRFKAEQTDATFDLIARLARKAAMVAGTADAGIWEYRQEWQPQTFSSLMCWAATDRMATIASVHRPPLAAEFRAEAERIRAEVIAKAWNERLSSFVSFYGGDALDASLLQMPPLRFLPGSDPRMVRTVDAIRSGLSQEGWLLRYRNDDGFGKPTVAFTICSFWLVEGLAATGRAAEARGVLEALRSVMTPLGLLSEDYEPSTRRLWGNFPQAYSHVGLIHAAFSASPGWSDIL